MLSAWTYSPLFGAAVLAVVLVAAVYLLRDRRSPGSTVAWLFAIAVLPLIGIPLYLLIGRRKILGARLRRPWRPEGKTTGNRLELLSDGREIYERLLTLIDGARTSVEISTYILGHDEVAGAVLERLTQKARSGVRVRLLLDAFGALWGHRAGIRRLREAGGQVAMFMPLLPYSLRGTSTLRNHRKIFVADGCRAITGGMNIATEYFGPKANPRRWDELGVWIEGPAAARLAEIFGVDWLFATGESIEPGVLSNNAEDGDELRVVPSGPDVEGDTFYDALLTGIFSARRRVWAVTPYFIPDETVTRALVVAARRGIDVRILVPDRGDIWIANFSRGSFLREIQDAGGRIYRYPRMIHAKALVIDDDRAIIGSANLDMRSFFLNFEVSVFVSSQPGVGRLAAWFEGLFGRAELGYPKAGSLPALLEAILRLFSPIL